MRDVDGADRDLIVAVVDDELAGYTRVGLVSEADPSGWWVVGLVVAEPLRRKGIGEALLRAAAQHVTSRADVLMSCYDRANGASADLHRAVGFVVVRDGGTRFPGYAPDNPDVTVRLELAPS